MTIKFELIRFTRPTPGSEALIGSIFADILDPTVLSFAVLKTQDTLTQIFHLRWVLNPCAQSDLLQNVMFQPLAPANGVPADATRDPVLKDKVHGEEILNVRKAYAFAGFTHKSPRAITYLRADKAFNPLPDTYGKPETIRGRSTVRVERDVLKGRAISM